MWPLVQPPAIRDPNRTRNEPTKQATARLPALGPNRFRHEGGITGQAVKRPVINTEAAMAPNITDVGQRLPTDRREAWRL